MSPLTVERGEDQAAPAVSGRKRRWTALLAIAAVVGLAVPIQRYATGADAFDTTLGASMGQTAPVPGTPYNFGVLWDLPSVTIDSTEVVLDDGSGPAAVAASVCVDSTIGGMPGPLGPNCVGADGVDLTGASPGTGIVLTVVPMTDQPVHVTGLRIRYHDGWRTGDQTLALNLGA